MSKRLYRRLVFVTGYQAGNQIYIILEPARGALSMSRVSYSLVYVKNYFETSVALILPDVSDCEIPNIDVD